MSKLLEFKVDQNAWDKYQNGLVKDILEDELKLSKWQILGLRLFGKILVNDEKAGIFDHAAVGDTVKVELSDDWTAEPAVKLDPEILYEEDDFVIVNKPSGIPTNANKGYQGISVESILKGFYDKLGKEVSLRALDSLGSTTSGLEIFAKNAPAFEKLSELLNEGKLKKNYLGIVQGLLADKIGVIDKPIKKVDGQIERIVAEDGEPAITNYEVLEERTINGEPYSVLSVNPDTRRSHQIRTHLKAIGHPLLGDELYGGKKTFIDRPALHGLYTKFISPFTNKEVEAKAPLPWDFEDLLSNGVDVKTYKSWLTDNDTVLTKGLLGGGALAAGAGLLKGLDFDKPKEVVNEKVADIDASLKEIQEAADVKLDDVDLNIKKPIDEKLAAGAAAVGLAGAALKDKVGDVKADLGDVALNLKDKVGDVKADLGEVALNVKGTVDDVKADLGAAAGTVKDKVDDAIDGVKAKLDDVNVEAPKVDLEAPKVEVERGVTKETGKKGGFWKWLIPLLLLCLLGLLGLRGCGNNGATANNAAAPAKRTQEEIYESLKAEFDPNANIEYGKSWDLNSILKGHEGDVSIIKDIDPTKVGPQELTIRLTTKDDDGNDVTRDYTQTVNIADTKLPEIKFNAPEVKIGVGETFDPSTNLSVSDPVDGVLKLGDSLTNGGYVVRSNVDTAVPGTYDVEVSAKDANGNESNGSFKVVVGDGGADASATAGSGSGDGSSTAGSGSGTSTDANAATSGSGTTGSGTTGGSDSNSDGTSLPNTLTSGN
ncbi:MAG: RluA family pseudouridine synthase [Solobacterium sp.]|nr:RluA family pseudouridine synthase [Solobacterium sp.]